MHTGNELHLRMKYWHEKYPFRFGLIFMIVYGMLDVADARWFIPKLAKDRCEGCQWIITRNGEH